MVHTEQSSLLHGSPRWVLVRTTGFGNPVLGWNISTRKRMGKTLQLYLLPESCALRRSLVGAREGAQAGWGLNKWHAPSTYTAWCSRAAVLLAMPPFKLMPKDHRTLLMEPVSSVVLADLQFHQPNSACWDSTKVLIGYGRCCKSQLKRWTQPVLLMSVSTVTADFIRQRACSCWHPVGMSSLSIPGPDTDCLDAKGTAEIGEENQWTQLSVQPPLHFNLCTYYDD